MKRKKRIKDVISKDMENSDKSRQIICKNLLFYTRSKLILFPIFFYKAENQRTPNNASRTLQKVIAKTEAKL
jgi:hypothetical protein